ncbi:MAG: hypothetical protein JSV09_11305, partial [Thermoplasmata archaeon]
DDNVEDEDENGWIDGDTDNNFVWDSGETWAESSPVDIDSDDDGLEDYHIFEGGSFEGHPNLLYIDTDGDGIQDGTEMGLSTPIPDTAEYFGTDTSRFVPDEDPDKTTHPDVRDSDGDGIWDGWHDTTPDGVWVPDSEQGGEDKNGNGRVDVDLQVADPTWQETDPTFIDSDFDGILDGIEDWDHDGVYEPDGDDGTPSNRDDETKGYDSDTDGDGLIDGEEDKNGDAFVDLDDLETDPRIKDTDGDGLWDGYGDGSHTGEKDVGTNPTDSDTDGDGLYDGWEDTIPNGILDPTEIGESQFGTDPISFDTDGDGFWDGWEPGQHSHRDNTDKANVCEYMFTVPFEGSYEVSVHVQGIPFLFFPPRMGVSIRDTRLYEDPIQLYNGEIDTTYTTYKFITPMLTGDNRLRFRNLQGTMNIDWVEINKRVTDPVNVDTDGDSLNDGVEFSGWDVFKVDTEGDKVTYHVVSDPTLVKTSTLVGGILGFFGQFDLDDLGKYQNSLNPRYIDTDGDGISDREEVEQRDAGEEDYDPNVQESTPPEIEEIRLSVEVDWLGNAKLVVKIWASDNAAVKEIKVRYDGKTHTAKDKGDYYKTDFGLGWNPIGSCFSYDVKVEAIDCADNAVEKKAHYEGTFEKVAKFLASMLQALWDTIAAVVEIIMDAIAALVDWIWGAMESIINAVLRPIFDAVNAFQHCVANLFTGMTDANKISEDFTDLFFNTHNLIFMSMGIAIAFQATTTIIGIFLTVISGGATQFTSFIVSAIVAGAVNSLSTELRNIIGMYFIGVAIGIMTEMLPTYTTAQDYLLNGLVSIGGFIILCVQAWSYKQQHGSLGKAFDTDMKAMIINIIISFAFLGLANLLNTLGQPEWALFVAFCSLVFTAYCTIKAQLDDNTWTDRLGGTLGIADELFGWAVVGYTALTFSADLDEYVYGRDPL